MLSRVPSHPPGMRPPAAGQCHNPPSGPTILDSEAAHGTRLLHLLASVPPPRVCPTAPPSMQLRAQTHLLTLTQLTRQAAGRTAGSPQHTASAVWTKGVHTRTEGSASLAGAHFVITTTLRKPLAGAHFGSVTRERRLEAKRGKSRLSDAPPTLIQCGCSPPQRCDENVLKGKGQQVAPGSGNTAPKQPSRVGHSGKLPKQLQP